VIFAFGEKRFKAQRYKRRISSSDQRIAGLAMLVITGCRRNDMTILQNILAGFVWLVAL